MKVARLKGVDKLEKTTGKLRILKGIIHVRDFPPLIHASSELVEPLFDIPVVNRRDREKIALEQGLVPEYLEEDNAQVEKTYQEPGKNDPNHPRI